MSLVTLSWLSLLFWLWPPFRQYKTRYFVYFLCLAATDPISHILRWGFHSQTNLHMLVIHTFLLLSLMHLEKTNKKFYVTVSALFFVIVTSILKPLVLTDLYLTILIHFSVFLIILKRAIENIFHRNIIKLFEIVLILYELIIVTKILNIVLEFTNAVHYFLITTIVQCFFAVFFVIWREDDKHITFQINLVKPAGK